MKLLALTFALLLAATARAAVVGNAISVGLATGGSKTAWKWNGKCVRWHPELAPATADGKLAKGRCVDVYVGMAGMYYLRLTTTPATAGKDALVIITVTSLMKGMSKPKLISWLYAKPENPATTTVGKGTYRVCIAGRNRAFDLCGFELYKCMTSNMCGMEVKTRDVMLLSQRRS